MPLPRVAASANRILSEATQFCGQPARTSGYAYNAGRRKMFQYRDSSQEGYGYIPFPPSQRVYEMRMEAEVERWFSVIYESDSVASVNLQRDICLGQSILKKVFT